MAMDLKEIESLIKEALTDATVEIQDLAGDGNHYSATVTSRIFNLFVTEQLELKEKYEKVPFGARKYLTS